MLHLKDLLVIEKPKKKSSQRSEMIEQIFEIYTSQQQRNFRKKENWKRYCAWCRENHLPNKEENQKKFKRSKNFIKEHGIKSFCFFLSHIPTADLHYVLSLAKDMKNRNQNFSGYIMSNITYKNENKHHNSYSVR